MDNSKGFAPLLQKRKIPPLQLRIFYYLLSFTALLLILLWLFQTVYLNDFYTKIKVKQIEGSAEAIQHNIDNEDIRSLLLRVAQNQEMCIRVYKFSQEGQSIRYDMPVLADCLIHNLLDIDVARLYYQAQDAGGTYTQTFDRSAFRNRSYNARMFIGPVPGPDSGLGESMILSRIFKNTAGDEFLLLLNTTVTPVDATVDTLRVQLIYISVMLVVVALILSFIIARHLAAPISSINDSAKKLARGDFSSRFDGKGYRETSELASTLNYAADELSRAGRLQRELVANISHDLRTPLTMIGGYAEMMRDLPTENNSENAQVIIDEVGRLSSLVNDVLDLSKLQAGVERLELRDFDLHEAAEPLVENFRRLGAPEGYSIEWQSAGEAWVHGDERKLTQVIYNFISNAMNYAGPDKSISVKLQRNATRARVEVTDHGPGIAPERQADIWQRYWRGAGGRKRGAGLGLSIAREVLEQHHASYGVISEIDKGSTFWFELPLV